MRVVVAGAGHFGRHHIRILSGMQGVDLVAAVDPDPVRAKEHCEPYGVPILPDLESLPEDIDAAVVAAPTEHHVQVATSLLSRGVSVLVEKPLARTKRRRAGR